MKTIKVNVQGCTEIVCVDYTKEMCEHDVTGCHKLPSLAAPVGKESEELRHRRSSLQ